MNFKNLTIVLISAFTLAACNTYKVDVDLTNEESSALQNDIKKFKEEIANFEPHEDAAIAWQAIIKLANAYEQMGELGKAIKLYEDTLADHPNTKSIINNLGRLYEKAGEYELAVEQYQRLVDDYFDRDYLYDITWAYIRGKDRKNAEKYFNAWQLEFQKTDEQTQQAIKKLREEEKAAE